MQTIHSKLPNVELDVCGQRIRFVNHKATVHNEIAPHILGIGHGFYTLVTDCTDALSRPGAKLAIIRDGGVGDVLMLTPLIRALAERHQPEIDVYTIAAIAPLLEGNPHIRHIGWLERDPIPDEYYDAILDLRLYVENHDRLNPANAMHRVDGFAHAADLTLSPADRHLDYFLREGEAQKAREQLRQTFDKAEAPLIAYVWRASTKQRSFTEAKHAEILLALLSRGWRVMVLDSERIELPSLYQMFDESLLWNATGGRTLREVAALIAAADVVVTPDTGPFHLASALSRPVVAYFSSHPVAERATHAALSVVNAAEKCSLFPCCKYGCLNRRGEDDLVACLDFPAQQLIAAVEERLTAGSQPAITVPDDAPILAGDRVIWGTALGAWGDVMISLAQIKRRLDLAQQDKCGVIYYGYDASITDFIAAQPFVSDVRRIAPPNDRSLYRYVVRQACEVPTPRSEWLVPLLVGSGIDPESVTLTHVTPDLYAWPEIYPLPAFALPEECESWAEKEAEKIARACNTDTWYIVNPYSFQSSRIDQHWPLWGVALDALGSGGDCNLVLTGQERVQGACGAFYDLSGGGTPSMMHLLALSKRAAGIVTTTNSLSLWSVAHRIPAVACCNQASDNPRNVFRMHADQPPNRVIGWHDSLEEFLWAWKLLRSAN